MSDYLLKAISRSGAIRGYAAITTDFVNEAYKRSEPASLSGVMLGRALTAGALMGGLVKDRERIALRFEGNGPIGSISVESDGHGRLRGSMKNSSVDFVEGEDSLSIQLKKSIGAAGVLTVSKDLGLKEPYRGTVQLVSGEIGEDVAYYLTESEQLPSAVSVGVIPSADGKSVDVAGGFLIQVIPSHGGNAASEEANIESINEMVGYLGSVLTHFKNGGTPETLLSKLFIEVPYTELTKTPLEYHCGCSHDSLLKAIAVLGAQEIESLAEQEGETEVICQFCKKKYYYSMDDFRTLI